jgi:hypothetical protein
VNFTACLILYQLAGNWVINIRDVVLLGRTAANWIYIHKDIKCALNAGNAYWRSVQNLLSYILLSKIFDNI